MAPHCCGFCQSAWMAPY